ncbi:MAG TPA: hypothetical protein VH114_06605 [Candidatus Acidoferrum sp.]|jgi:hypothetical protein|nr:hypothetical protein [Candidatus Acidoferrum sp.]
MKLTSAALLAGLLFASGVAFARPQSTQTGSDQTKPDSNATKSGQSAANNKKKTPPGGSPSTTPSLPSQPSSDLNAISSGTPASKPVAAQKPAPPANSAGLVWVNTESGVYHKRGTRWYGKTKQGKYMTEADAKKAGYHAAAKE